MSEYIHRRRKGSPRFSLCGCRVSRDRIDKAAGRKTTCIGCLRMVRSPVAAMLKQYMLPEARDRIVAEYWATIPEPPSRSGLYPISPGPAIEPSRAPPKPRKQAELLGIEVTPEITFDLIRYFIHNELAEPGQAKMVRKKIVAAFGIQSARELLKKVGLK